GTDGYVAGEHRQHLGLLVVIGAAVVDAGVDGRLDHALCLGGVGQEGAARPRQSREQRYGNKCSPHLPRSAITTATAPHTAAPAVPMALHTASLKPSARARPENPA